MVTHDEGPELTSRAPRSIADVVRGFDRAQLTTLLRLRPDLARPRPSTLGEVVERANTHPSTRAAIDTLDAWQRRVCHALAACPDAVSLRHLAALLGADRGAVESAVKDLRDRALAWGDDRHVRVTQAVRACFGTHPGGLARPSATPLSTGEIDERLGQAGSEAERLVEQLLWTSPVGKVTGADRALRLEHATSPAERLLALKLLRPLDSDTVILPREVALHRRGGRLFRNEVASQVPAWPAGTESRVAETAGLGTAVEFVHRLTAVVEEIERTSPVPLATGAFRRRDQSTLAAATGAGEQIGFMLTLAHRLGLVARTATVWLPTHTFDQWAGSAAFLRWQSAVKAWLELSGWPLQASSQPGRDDADAAERGRLAAVRELRAAPVGATIGTQTLAARLSWRHPTWSSVEVDHAAAQTVAEATALGLIAMGKRTSLWDVSDDPGFPEAGDRFVLQSDLTAVAAGPLVLAVSRVLDLIGDRESPGPASVHRFTAGSIRRALDAGWTGERLLAWFAEHSLTPVPQPLTYLVGDVARGHGSIRVASVGALLTIEDEASLETLLRHPQASTLGLRRIGPAVVAASAEAADVVELLRDLGLAPVAEDSHGDVVPTPSARRLRPAAQPPRPTNPGNDHLTQLAGALLGSAGSVQAAVDAESMLAALLGAQTSGTWVQVTSVDDSGRPSRSQAKVLAVASGQARLVERGRGQRVVPLSRIVAVAGD